MADPIVFGRTQSAAGTPFDNSSNGFTAVNVQAAIEEVGSGLVLRNIDCTSATAVADVVKVVSGTASPALADSLANSNMIGVVVRKESSVLCDIRVSGVTGAVFSGLDETKEYFLSESTAGLVTLTAPSGSGEVVVRVGQPFSGTELMVNKGTRTQLA